MTSAGPIASGDHAVQAACPACGSPAFTVEGRPGPASETEMGGRVFRQPPFEARRCRDCSLVFKSDILAPETFSDYYRRTDFRKWEIPGLHPTETRILELLRELPAGSRVLDFGCSSGRLLGALKGDYQRFGLEINDEAAKMAEAKGVAIVPPDLLDHPGDDPGFDAIVMVDVFEHLTAPTEFLRKLAKLLRPGGRLILCTGDSDAKEARGEPARFWYLKLIEHVCVLNRDHARYLAKALGLELTHAETWTHFAFPLKTRAQQWIYGRAYDAFHGRGPRPLAAVLGLVPKLKRAKGWDAPPNWIGSRDHLILAYRKTP